MLLLAGGGAPDREWRRFLSRWLGLSLLLILVAAFHSTGFHHADEYFQTLEFVSAKLGRTPTVDLPWEFHHRMRPWLQPGLYYVMARAWTAVGVDNPFVWVWSFRLLSGVVAWLGLAGLALCAYGWFPDDEARRGAVRALCLLCFIPYLAVRTSSESLSTSCFVLALSLLVLGSRSGGEASPPVCPRGLLLLVGVLSGLAVEFRYQVAILVAGLVAWAIAVAGIPFRRILWIVVGMAAATGLGALADRWGYGAWVLPPFHYLRENLWADRAAQQFGTYPWYGYLLLPLRNPLAPLAFILVLGMIFCWVRHPRHVLTWTAMPFFLVHSLVAHKELRFLFPIALLTPLFLLLSVAPMNDRWDPWVRRVWAVRSRPFLRVVYGLNLAALAVFCLTPFTLEVNFQKFVYDHFPSGIEAYVLSPRSPYQHADLRMYLYRPAGLVLRPATAEQYRTERAAREAAPLHVILESFDTPESLGLDGCETLYQSLPGWLRRFGWKGRKETWDLYRCSGQGRR